jgi:hypothetical protein
LRFSTATPRADAEPPAAINKVSKSMVELKFMELS